MRKFLRIFRNFFLLFLLAFAVWSYKNNDNVRIATNNSANNLVQKFNQFFIPKSDKQANLRQQKTHTRTAPKADNNIKNGQYLWSNNRATVYLDISHNQQLRTATIEAMNAWNRTGVFLFQQTNQKKKADIVVTIMNDSDTQAAGQTSITYDQNNGKLMRAHVELNRYYLQNSWYNYSHNRIVNTAEHELGHAIGLKHTKKVSVMYPKGSIYTIQPYDIQAVKKLYHEK